MDFVELNALLDKNDVTADLAIDLLDWTFKYI
jgi:arginase